MLVIDDADERYVVIDMLQNLVLLMKSASRDCVHVSKHGRPKIDIGEEQLSYLIKQGFRTKEISKIFGCSRRTVERRMNEYELSLLNSMAVSDAHLDSLVKDISTLFPVCGEKIVNGRLRSYNIGVPRQRINCGLNQLQSVMLHCIYEFSCNLNTSARGVAVSTSNLTTIFIMYW